MILEADGIWLEFGLQKILQSIYIKCETGKITGLLGRNGQGKTCLLQVIAGSLNAQSRSVRVDGRALSKTPGPETLMYLPQSNFIPASLTLGRVFKDFNAAYEQFEQVFPEFANRYKDKLKDLSGGQRRLVEVYLILSSRAKFILLDEPFTQIMPVHVEKIQDLLRVEKKNKGILLTDHLYQQVTPLCDSLYVLNNGQTQLAANPNDLEMPGYATPFDKQPG